MSSEIIVLLGLAIAAALASSALAAWSVGELSRAIQSISDKLRISRRETERLREEVGSLRRASKDAGGNGTETAAIATAVNGLNREVGRLAKELDLAAAELTRLRGRVKRNTARLGRSDAGTGGTSGESPQTAEGLPSYSPAAPTAPPPGPPAGLPGAGVITAEALVGAISCASRPDISQLVVWLETPPGAEWLDRLSWGEGPVGGSVKLHLRLEADPRCVALSRPREERTEILFAPWLSELTVAKVGMQFAELADVTPPDAHPSKAVVTLQRVGYLLLESRDWLDIWQRLEHEDRTRWLDMFRLADESSRAAAVLGIAD